MARKDRTGNRKPRDQKRPCKVPELGYYLIVTDTEATERNYFYGLRDALPESVRNRLVIKVVETRTKELLKKCHEYTAYSAQFYSPWIVFDRDEVPDFDEIISAAEAQGIHVGWSNPCFEIWLYAYWGKMPSALSSQKCCADFGNEYARRTEQKYSKADKRLYERLIKYGDETGAIRLAQKRLEQHQKAGRTTPSEMSPCTTVHRLIEELRNKS